MPTRDRKAAARGQVAPPLPHAGPTSAESALVNRLHSNATHRAGNLGYRVVDMRGVDIIDRSKAVAWFRLSFGNLMVAVDGIADWGEWNATLETGAERYRAARDRLRAGMPAL